MESTGTTSINELEEYIEVLQYQLEGICNQLAELKDKRCQLEDKLFEAKFKRITQLKEQNG